MRLSPLDIRKQDFDTSLRGYSKEDVDAFLHMLSEQWEEVLDEQRRLEEEVRTLEGKMEHYQQVEEALQEALQTARENAEQKLENAQREAKLLIQEAEGRADDIKREAQEDRNRLRRQADQLQERRDKVRARLRAFLTSELELLLRFEGEDPGQLRDALPGDLAQHLTEAHGSAARADPADVKASAPQGVFDAGSASGETPAGRPDSEHDQARQQTGGGPVPGEGPEQQTEQTEQTAKQDAVSKGEALGELTGFLEQLGASSGQEAGEQRMEAPSEDDTPASDPQPERSASASGPGVPAPGDESAKAQSPELEALFASTEETVAGDGGLSEANSDDDLTPTADEIEKIRRILDDME